MDDLHSGVPVSPEGQLPPRIRGRGTARRVATGGVRGVRARKGKPRGGQPTDPVCQAVRSSAPPQEQSGAKPLTPLTPPEVEAIGGTAERLSESPKGSHRAQRTVSRAALVHYGLTRAIAATAQNRPQAEQILRELDALEMSVPDDKAEGKPGEDSGSLLRREVTRIERRARVK